MGTFLVIVSKDVSNASLGVNELAASAFDGQLATQVGNVGFDDCDLAIPVVFPDVIEDLHLGNDTSLIDHEVAQQLELGGGQIDRHSSTSDFMCVFVDDKVSDAQLPVVAAFA